MINLSMLPWSVKEVTVALVYLEQVARHSVQLMWELNNTLLRSELNVSDMKKNHHHYFSYSSPLLTNFLNLN